jgi:hypothetical protein
MEHPQSFSVLKLNSELNCHPERRSPWRPESKDLRLFFKGLRNHGGDFHAVSRPHGVALFAARVGFHSLPNPEAEVSA